MTDRGPRRGQAGFTLLEIMIALAILAVGAVCVMSTFAAAIALHLRREGDVRAARVMEEARHEAQKVWDSWLPTDRAPLPPPVKDLTYERDPSIGYSISFEAVPGQPKGLDGAPAGVLAVVRVVRETEGETARAREMRVFLVRSGFRAEELKDSWTFRKEKEQQKMKEQEPPSQPRDR